ncbi:MAG TPA: OsmC family protein [Bacillota bacterium]|nr:OsmC family protein [Bacillota bacterium]
MNKMEMFQEMTKRIQADDSLAVSVWRGTFEFVGGEPTASKIENLNPIEGMPEMPKGKMTAVEMLVVSAANCYATTFHKNAYFNKISFSKVKIQFTGKFDQKPFLGLNDGNPGMIEPEIVLSVESSADATKIEKIANLSITESPVLMSLNQDVSLTIQ